MTQRAKFEDKRADLSGDFGRDYAMKVFGLSLEELEKLVGRYTRGARKGQLRGTLVWAVVVEGGWVRTHCYGGGGFVTRPGRRFGHGIVESWTGKLMYGIDLQKEGHAMALLLSKHAGMKEPTPVVEVLDYEATIGFMQSAQMAGCNLEDVAGLVHDLMYGK